MWPVPIKMPPGLLCAVADDFRDDRQWLACSHHPRKLLEGVEVEGATFEVAGKRRTDTVRVALASLRLLDLPLFPPCVGGKSAQNN